VKKKSTFNEFAQPVEVHSLSWKRRTTSDGHW